MIYLDYNAASPLRSIVQAAMVQAFDGYGNPSSVHAAGRAARRLIEDARRAVRDVLGARSAQVVFAGSATEINNAVLRGVAHDRRVVSAADHESLHAVADDHIIDVWPLLADGLLDLDWLARYLRECAGRVLVCMSAVNGEAGIIQPTAAVAALCAARADTHLHVDAVQAVGKLDADQYVPYGDTHTLAFHKIGGPRGVGVLLARNEACFPEPLLRGGGQERRQRAGTENVVAIAGVSALLNASFAEIMQAENARLRVMSDRALDAWMAHPDALVLGAHAPRVANTLYCAAPWLTAETAVIAADLAGICVSAGSACSSGKAAASRLPAALGRPDLGGRAVRLSSGHQSGDDDMTQALARIARSAFDGHHGK